MPKKTQQTVSFKARWVIESPIIYKANAFRSVYTPHSIVIYFGLVDPEDMLPEKVKSLKAAEIKTLARYCLDQDDLIRLKTEIDKTVDGLKKKGKLKK